MSEMKDKFKKADENNRLLSAYRPLPPETLKSLREYYRVGLTYTSNALEGNSLTESETKVVIEDGLTIEGKPLRDHYEAVGHAKAYDYIYQITEKEGLEEEDILALHRLFYQQIDAEKAGKYRDVKVYISGSRYAVSAVSKVPAVLRHEYIYSLEAAHTRPEVFVDFIADRVIATQLDLLRLMREDDDTVNDTVNDTVKAVAPQLSKTEQTVLNAISTYPNYSYEKLATYCQLSRPTIARTIKALQSREFIRRIGSDKTGHWEVIGKEDEV